MCPTKKKKPCIKTMDLYRLPWSMSDNAFSWLEPTRFCDLDCEYCYQIHDPKSHKSLEQFQQELEGLMELRKTDAVFIAGGEPLTHPNIVEIVKMVKDHGIKPMILTNGNALTPELTHKLRKAGCYGFVFHVDKHQNRPGWNGRSETGMNQLRQDLADMVYNEGGMICGYNITIVPDTLKEVPAIVDWATKNMDRVDFCVIIPVRMIHKDDPFDYYAGTEKIDLSKTFLGQKKRYKHMTAVDLYEQILKVLPGYEFSSFLGGTVRSNVPKWLIGSHIGSGDRVYGTTGPRTMELLQNIHHSFKGTYFSFLRRAIGNNGRLAFGLGVIDRRIRKTFRQYLKTAVRHPSELFKKVYIQTFIVMQPQDVLPNGEQDRCDGCPNKTYWNGRLVSECRMEEYLKYGRLMTMVPKKGCNVTCSSDGAQVGAEV